MDQGIGQAMAWDVLTSFNPAPRSLEQEHWAHERMGELSFPSDRLRSDHFPLGQKKSRFSSFKERLLLLPN